METLHNLKATALFNLEAGQFVKSNITDLGTAGINLSTDPIIENYVSQMTTDSNSMDLALIQIRKQQETDALEVLDQNRDSSFVRLNMQLRVFQKSRIIAEVAAYNTLAIPFNTYKDIDDLNYEAESNAIDNFLVELEKPMYASAIATLNLGNLISLLYEDNKAFKILFSARSTNVAGTTVYDAKVIRKQMFATYNAYATYVLALTNATQGQPNHAYYKSIFDIVNNIRKYYSDALARREGSRA
jgi:hypothetical protein